MWVSRNWPPIYILETDLQINLNRGYRHANRNLRTQSLRVKGNHASSHDTVVIIIIAILYSSRQTRLRLKFLLAFDLPAILSFSFLQAVETRHDIEKLGSRKSLIPPSNTCHQNKRHILINPGDQSIYVIFFPVEIFVPLSFNGVGCYGQDSTPRLWSKQLSIYLKTRPPRTLSVGRRRKCEMQGESS
jgi:hypothetical protein